jgi:vancomycin permeability regulator SanA
LLGSILLAVIVTDAILVYSYYKLAVRFLEGQPNWRSVDAGIVFFGDYVEDGARLGPDSEKRARCAIDLFHSDKINVIVCVGGYEINQWRGKPHRMKEFLVQNGIPEKYIVHDSLSFNTLTNIQEAEKIMQTHRLQTAVAISEPLHVYRISRFIKNDSIFFEAYLHRPSSPVEYWRLFRNVHREWVSRMLSLVLKDEMRNRLVFLYRTLRNKIDPLI